ncbi:MAG: hypothetical protein RBT45_01250 [Acholeplasmataceae bacterium]|jgi:hypothetical protein|nr:hypothetical protein [Acholeplasmataceae bacterium]
MQIGKKSQKIHLKIMLINYFVVILNAILLYVYTYEYQKLWLFIMMIVLVLVPVLSIFAYFVRRKMTKAMIGSSQLRKLQLQFLNQPLINFQLFLFFWSHLTIIVYALNDMIDWMQNEYFNYIIIMQYMLTLIIYLFLMSLRRTSTIYGSHI